MATYRYIGDGSFLTGVPARDLDGDEDMACVEQFEKREGVKLESTGLYEKAKASRATSEGVATDG